MVPRRFKKRSSEADLLVARARRAGIKLLALTHVGGDGTLRTLDIAPRDAAHFADLLEGGERADGSSLFKGSGISPQASDVLLRPRPQSVFLDPFSQQPTLMVLCSHAGRDGSPLPESPDTIVRRAYERLRHTRDIDLWAHGEVEFFLGHRRSDGESRAADEQGYHAASPFVAGQALRRKALALLADMGVPIKYGHSEVGYLADGDAEGWIWEQHEIELGLAPLPEAADAVVLTHWVLRNLAQEAGMRVSFAPILKEGHAGSGLHFHFSPRRHGREVAARKADGSFDEGAKWLLGSLVRFAPALMAFGNRTPESFTRLRQGKEAPNRVAWGEFDRLALVRIPVVATTKAGRVVTPPTIEFRLPDGSAHPHLLLAAVAQALAAGPEIPKLDDLLRKTSAPNVRKDPESAPQLPVTFAQIAEALAAARPVFGAGGVFPVSFLEAAETQLRRAEPLRLTLSGRSL
jgi:glutamine synthetase